VISTGPGIEVHVVIADDLETDMTIACKQALSLFLRYRAKENDRQKDIVPGGTLQ